MKIEITDDKGDVSTMDGVYAYGLAYQLKTEDGVSVSSGRCVVEMPNELVGLLTTLIENVRSFRADRILTDKMAQFFAAITQQAEHGKPPSLKLVKPDGSPAG